MVTNRGADGSERTIGVGSGSNNEGAIFALTFAALDIILLFLFEPFFRCTVGGVHFLLGEGASLTTVRGGIHERGELRDQVNI